MEILLMLIFLTTVLTVWFMVDRLEKMQRQLDALSFNKGERTLRVEV
jgi:sporulation-control protein spo0M